jgi:N,N-dimethylformamidase beta subunit-like, C-terminal
MFCERPACYQAGVLAALASSALLFGLYVDNGSTPYQGDDRYLTTVSPNGDGFRDAAHIRFALRRPAEVSVEVIANNTAKGDAEKGARVVVQRIRARTFGTGESEIVWRPARTTAPRTYVLKLRVDGKPTTVSPVVRVQGIDAGFFEPSFAPGEDAAVRVATDAKTLAFQVFAYGGGRFPSVRDLRTNGQAMTTAARVDWSSHRDAPATIHVVRPGEWPSGLYFLRVSAGDGRVGYAPFIVRPRTLGSKRVAVVLATYTWQAYNFLDADGNGWGDSWYVSGKTHHIDISRPFLDFGIPFRFNDWDLSFLTWLQRSGKEADFLSDQDVDASTGDELAQAYDLIVFPGHEEYVTEPERTAITRYRDLGGNLAFLAANNMFWQVRVAGNAMTKVQLWRKLGQPEAAVIGVQYVGSNHGAVQKPFVVTGATQAPWLFAGTGLQSGSAFGRYGIEIDARAASSPPGTIVLARIPDLLGPGRSAEMTYYETPAGAKVFAAGAINFAATATAAPVSILLENLWLRLARP